MSVTIRGRMPKAPHDGLAHLTDTLQEHPGQQIIAVALLEPDHVVEKLNDESDPVEIKMRVVSVEAMSGMDANAAQTLLTVAFENRTGLKGLPFGTTADSE